MKYFNRKHTLLEAVTSVQLLESKQSIDILNRVKIYQQELRIYQGEADMWVNRAEKRANEQKDRVRTVFENLTEFCSDNAEGH